MMLLTTPAALIQKLAAEAIAGLLAITTAGLPAQPVQDDIRAQQWHLDFFNIDQVHQISTGKGVIVGVIDTGVDGGHPDLAGRLLPGLDLSFRERPDALEDLHGHGTAMDQYGHGIINPLAALTADIPPLNPPTTDTPTYNATPPPPQPTNPRPLILATLGILFVVLLTGAVIMTLRRPT
jgi:hypothetical protein